MPESARTRFLRLWFNWFPAYRGTGARVTYIADDYREVRIRLPLSWRTRNYVGTIFGGSLYAALDPMYMLMLIRILGPGYVVWDKEANIRFRRPGRETLYARFRISQETIDAIVQAVERDGKVDCVFDVDLADAAGTVHATCIKTVYVARRGDR